MTNTNGRSSRVFVAWLLIGTSVAVLAGADGPAATSKRAIAPVAPVLPAQVVAAMQEGKYAEAIAGLDRLTAEAKEPADQRLLRPDPRDRPAARGQARRGPRDLDGRPEGRARRARGPRSSAPSWPPSSWPRAGPRRPRRWPAPRPSGCWPAIARTGSPRSTTPSPTPPQARRPHHPARPERRLRAADPGPRPGQGDGLARSLLPRDGPRQPAASGQPRPGHRRTSRPTSRIPQGGRPGRGPLPPRRVPARRRPAPRRPR